jgi:hypothetical protein
MSTIERIFKYIGYKGISVNEFSKTIDVSNGYFAKQKGANANIGSQIIEKIVNNYPELNTDWLITGNGDMLRSCSKQNVPFHAPQIPSAPPASALPQHKYTNKKETAQENTYIIEKLLQEVKNLSKEIGRLEAQIAHLQEQLAKKNVVQNVVANVA